MATLTKHQPEKPPSLDEAAEYQDALRVFSQAVAAHRRAEQARKEWERRCNHADETVRAVAALERPNVEQDFWRTKITMDENQKACDAARTKARQPLLDYYLARDRELVQQLYAAIDRVIPLNELVRSNWVEAQTHDVPIEQHFWHELLENVREWTSLLEHRREMLRSEGIL